MRKIDVHDKAIVLVLTKAEAKALKDRLEMHTGIIKTKPFLRVVEKLEVAMCEF